MNSEKKTKKKSALGITLSTLWWSAVVLLVLLLVNILGAKMTGNVPRVFGYSIMNIVSGSMEDEIPRGSYILIKKVEPEKVKRGDVICFYSTDPQIYGLPNTHRVVEDPINNNGIIEFVTRGDANPINDKETAKGENLIGVYVKRLDTLTAFSNALKGNMMIFVIISLQICMFGMALFAVIAIKVNKNSDGIGRNEEDKKE